MISMVPRIPQDEVETAEREKEDSLDSRLATVESRDPPLPCQYLEGSGRHIRNVLVLQGRM